MTTQKAYRLHSYGGPECIKLDDTPVPVPGPSQVLVAVSVVGMNPFDWKIREGYAKDEMPLPLPVTIGVDFSGTVVGLGEGSLRFKIGDRVTTLSTSLGAFAEYIVVDESILGRVPIEVSDALAVTLQMPVATAWQTFHRVGEVWAGKHILIHGSSGIVGAFTMQFAKAVCTTVYATASAKNRDYVIGLVADIFIDYQTQKFEDYVKDIDLLLDYILIGGTDNTTDRSWGVLKAGGALVTAADPTIMGKVPAGFRGYFPNIQADAKLF